MRIVQNLFIGLLIAALASYRGSGSVSADNEPPKNESPASNDKLANAEVMADLDDATVEAISLINDMDSEPTTLVQEFDERIESIEHLIEGGEFSSGDLTEILDELPAIASASSASGAYATLRVYSSVLSELGQRETSSFDSLRLSALNDALEALPKYQFDPYVYPIVAETMRMASSMVSTIMVL